MPPLTWMAVAGDAIAIIALSVLLYADKIPLEFFASTFTALVVARGVASKAKDQGGSDGKGGGVSPGAVSGLAILASLLASYLSRGRIAITTLALAFALALASCHPERPACSPAALAALEAAYLDEVVTACEGEGFDECAARPAIEARYALEREEWARCR